MSDFKKGVFATRRDGLGERLNSVFNGLLVANALDVPFGFKWPGSYAFNDAFHSLRPATEIFDPVFLEKYLLPDDTILASDGVLRCPKGSLGAIRQGLSAQFEQGARSAPQHSFIFNVADGPDRVNLHASVVSALSFKENLRDLMAHTHSKCKKDPAHVVMHIRAGDIIYGKYREFPSFTNKIMPLPLAIVIARRFLGSGLNVKLLGQETSAIQKMGERIDLTMPLSRPQGLTPDTLLDGFFDLAQVGAAQTIYAGNSGFTRFSSQYYLKPVMNPLRNYPPLGLMDEVFLEMAKNDDIYSPEQKAYTNFYYYLLLESSGDVVLSTLLDRAVEFQPDNMMFQLWSVLNDIKYSRYSKADQKFTGLWHQADKHDFSTFCQSPWLGMLSRNEVMSSLRCYAYFSEFIDRGVLASSKASKVLRFFLDQSSPLQEHEWVGLRGLL
jgi:hypothetical protein